ncbi:FAD-dependent oxidoreductase [Salinifilum ghardaiensis]
MGRALRVAIIGTGPAGIYTADALDKSDSDVTIDIFDRMPAPFGLIRYGVAPDHPRIKGVVAALHRIMERPAIRFFGNVDYGTDLKLADLRQHYDAVVLATGADHDRGLDIPGIDLPHSHGAAGFVQWYDGLPEAPRDWTLDSEQVAVIGAGNVALDVARVLAKPAESLLSTEIPDNVHAGLRASRVTDVHVFARRGPAEAKFTPLELRELDHQPDVDVRVAPEGCDVDEAGEQAIHSSNQVKNVVTTLQDWALRDPREDTARRLHLHFLRAPVAVTGQQRVTGLRTEIMELDGAGGVRGTGEHETWPVGQVYRAVGYRSSRAADLPFDERSGTVPHAGGRVLGEHGRHLDGVYTTGWIKRGPVGLIGHTKSDAAETVASLLADAEPNAAEPSPEALPRLLDERGVSYTTWEGWQRLDGHEQALGAERERERMKVVPREEMVRISRAAD